MTQHLAPFVAEENNYLSQKERITTFFDALKDPSRFSNINIQLDLKNLQQEYLMEIAEQADTFSQTKMGFVVRSYKFNQEAALKIIEKVSSRLVLTGFFSYKDGKIVQKAWEKYREGISDEEISNLYLFDATVKNLLNNRNVPEDTYRTVYSAAMKLDSHSRRLYRGFLNPEYNIDFQVEVFENWLKIMEMREIEQEVLGLYMDVSWYDERYLYFLKRAFHRYMEVNEVEIPFSWFMDLNNYPTYLFNLLIAEDEIQFDPYDLSLKVDGFV